MLVILIQTHTTVMKKREELILCRSQSFSLFSLWFVLLLWGSATLWHLQVTVAFTGCNTYLSLSAEKNLAMIYLELFYCWRWSRFSFPSLPPPFSSHEVNTKPALLSLCFAVKGMKIQGQQNTTSSKTMELFGPFHWLTESRFRSPVSTTNKSESLSWAVRHIG